MNNDSTKPAGTMPGFLKKNPEPTSDKPKNEYQTPSSNLGMFRKYAQEKPSEPQKYQIPTSSYDKSSYSYQSTGNKTAEELSVSSSTATSLSP